MIYKQWLKILSTIDDENNLSRDDIIEKIKKKLEVIDRNTYKEWREVGFNVNYIISNKEQWTLLHIAAENGHTETVKALIENGANVNAVDREKMTPLHLAVENGHTETVKALIENGADVNIVNQEKMAPLHLAVENGYTETAKALIENGADVNVMDRSGLTPLYLAAKNGYKEVAYALMEKGANPLLGNRTLKYLAELIESDNLKQLRKERRDDEYELVKYSLLCRDNRSLVDIIEEDTFDDLICTWFAEAHDLTSSQEELNKNLLSILKDLLSCNGYGCIPRLKKFLQDNENNQDLERVLNLRRGESKLTVLHAVSGILGITGIEEKCGDSVALLLIAGANPNIKDDRGKTPLHYTTGVCSMSSLLRKGANPNEQDNEGKTPLHYIASTSNNWCVNLLLKNGARSDICNKQGETPLDIAIDNCNCYAEEYLLTDNQEVLRRELYNILDDVDEDNPSSLNEGLTELKKFLGKHKDNQDLKRILILHDDKEKSQIFQRIRDVFHSNEAFCKKAEGLLSTAGAKDCEGLDRKKSLPKSGTLWDNLILNQQEKLKVFLDWVGKAKDMNQLEQIVNKAIECGVRFNFPHQGQLYGKMYESKYSFMDRVIRQIKEISESKKNLKVASDIVCKLVSRGAVLYDIDSTFVIGTLESEFKDHKTNMIKAYEEYVNRTLEFMEIVKSAATGKVKNAKVDNSTLYLEYSEDSTINVAEITDGARSLGLTQGEIEYGRDVIKIGKSEVEIITENGIRNYTDLADDSDIALIFYTSQGELEVRLYPDTQNKDLVRVEVSNKEEILKKFKGCEEEIGENCLLGGYWVYYAIEQGYFERSEKLCQSSERINLPKKIVEENSQNSWTGKVQHSRENRAGVQI
jgi:ankyrin repeat protein